MNKMHGKVAFITGAARGQGRAHALRLATEGAGIIATDVCEQIPSVPYDLASDSDLQVTVDEVRALGGKIIGLRADVRDQQALLAAVQAGLDEFGQIDVVVANAGIAPLALDDPDPLATFRDVIDVNLVGVWNTVRATVAPMIERGAGGSIILISSFAGLKGFGANLMAAAEAYTASKHGVVGLMRVFAQELGQHSIRVNTIHPGGVNTPMLQGPTFAEVLAAEPAIAGALKAALPVGALEADDISGAVLWLASDDARFVTGVSVPVDAGAVVM